MKTKYLVVIVFLLMLAAVGFGAYSIFTDVKSPAEKNVSGMNHQNATYTVEGRTVTLVDGVALIETAPGAASHDTVRYFGNELTKDLDGDGDDDIAFLITEETGGSGTFFYAVVAVNDNGTYRGSEALFLGDRIAPQTTESGEGNSFIVNYAERAPGEPMTAQPSVGKSVRVLLDADTLTLGEWVRDFEGESNVGGKLKADVFTGTLEEVNTGCFADGECYVVIDGKHVTVLRGWSTETVGKILGVEGFGDLESHIGEMIEVYAQQLPDDTFTLYGSEGFYIKLLGSTSGSGGGQGITVGEPNPNVPKPPYDSDSPRPQLLPDRCTTGGCSGQLCGEAGVMRDITTTCEYRKEYACYKSAVCERQATGECGWTETAELTQCLTDLEDTQVTAE
jgi:hypothetical protein